MTSVSTAEQAVNTGTSSDQQTVETRGSRARRWTRFGVVGASGLVVNQVLLVLITEVLGAWYLVSAVIATLGSTSWNFLWADRWVFADRSSDGATRRRFAGFLVLNLALLPARLPILWFLTEVVGLHYAWSNAISLGAMFAVRMLVADQWLWRSRNADAPGRSSEGAASVGATRHEYNVAGILTVHSDIELRELRHFRAAGTGTPDMRITVGLVSPKPTRRVRFEEHDDTLVYREHLGPAGANFSLRMGSPIEIRVSPLLAISPHVVYTNIVEAFLRFLLVSKGYVLLHSAGLADENGVTLLSAQTDTGKTSTVISLVRSRGYRFLSDDMTIIDPAGRAISYPKPMTLSFHTMGVAKDGKLTKWDRAKLSVQSRLHSKSGREVGRTLGERNIPIMSLNSFVQFLVPPPKHRIESLFECEVGGAGTIRNVILLAKGEERLEPSAIAETVDQLIDNTDDAYGFPPFSTFAPRIRIAGDDYLTLRRKERELLALAIGDAARWHLSVKGYGWADVIPSIMDGTPGFPVAADGPDSTPVAVRQPVPVMRPSSPIPVMQTAMDEVPALGHEPISVAGTSAFDPSFEPAAFAASGVALEPAAIGDHQPSSIH